MTKNRGECTDSIVPTVGIATFHRSLNFGAVLQAYALQQTLKAHGVDSEFIDFRKGEHISRDRTLKSRLRRALLWVWDAPRRRKFDRFVGEHLKTSKYFPTYREVQEHRFPYRAVVCGSDQVWNPELTEATLPFFLLEFLPDTIARVAYAPSCGNKEAVQARAEEFRQALPRFAALSIRESEELELIGDFAGGREVRTCIDPTLLGGEALWEAVAVSPPEREPYMFFYSFGAPRELTALAERIALARGLKIVHFHKGRHFNCANRRVQPGPEEFVSLVKNAECVLTNSFHGLVFSVIFEKEFLVQNVKGRGARIRTLAAELGFEQRCINAAEFAGTDIPDLDYGELKRRLERLRASSLEYLLEALHVH